MDLDLDLVAKMRDLGSHSQREDLVDSEKIHSRSRVLAYSM